MNFISHSPSSEDFSLRQKAKEIASLIYETPAEALAFGVAAAASRLFGLPFAAPFLGISAGLFATKLVLKILGRYNDSALVELSKRACKLNRDMPKLQIITFIFALTISTISQTIGFISGIGLGSYGAVVLDIENYNLIRLANRRRRSY